MASLSGKEILVIDDADDARLLARKILEVDGATVSDAATIDAGIEFARRFAPHLILVDLELPGKSGFDFLEFRKSDPQLSALPAIVISGRRDQASVMRAISLGATDYILKPFRAVQVLQKVRKVLKLSGFLSKPVPNGPQSEATLSVAAEIMKLNEVGFLMESPIKLGPEVDVQIVAEIVSELQLSGLKMRSVQTPGKYIAAGRYLTEINFIGISREAANRIRAKIASSK